MIGGLPAVNNNQKLLAKFHSGTLRMIDTMRLISLFFKLLLEYLLELLLRCLQFRENLNSKFSTLYTFTLCTLIHQCQSISFLTRYHCLGKLMYRRLQDRVAF